MSLVHWVNDGLMAVFFLVVGLEIKRELRMGELREPRTALLPIVAAVGGAIVPALIYLGSTWAARARRAGASRWPRTSRSRWACWPSSGRGCPARCKLFLTTLAIVDDLLAVLVIAAVLHRAPSTCWASPRPSSAWRCSSSPIGAGVRSLAVYGVLGVALWVGVLVSGVHATIAGVLLAFTIPAVVGADARRRSADPLAAHRASSTCCTPGRPSSSCPSSRSPTRASG